MLVDIAATLLSSAYYDFTSSTCLPYESHIWRMGYYPPSGPSADLWVLTAMKKQIIINKILFIKKDTSAYMVQSTAH
jgi:hypothetical protein